MCVPKANPRGNFVKIVTVQNTYLSISGIKVYTNSRQRGSSSRRGRSSSRRGRSSSRTVYGVGLKGASQSSPYGNNAYPATNAFDRSGRKFTHTNKGVGMWWKADFGGDYQISLVKIRNRKDCCGNRLAGSKIFIGNTQCGTIENGTKKNQWYQVKCNARGGFVKIVTVQNTYLSISGIKVYTNSRQRRSSSRRSSSRSVTLYGVRLQGASQSSPYGNNAYPASNALGNFRKFTHTNKGVGMWWKADFGGDYQI
jgi:hypothetical protein